MTTGNTNPNQVIELRSLGSQMVQIPYAKQRKTASNKNPEESDFKSERTKLNFFIQKKKKEFMVRNSSFTTEAHTNHGYTIFH